MKDFKKVNKTFISDYKESPPKQKKMYTQFMESQLNNIGKLELNSKKSYNWKLIYKSIHHKELNSQVTK